VIYNVSKRAVGVSVNKLVRPTTVWLTMRVERRL
jgi:hypothetical protein